MKNVFTIIAVALASFAAGAAAAELRLKSDCRPSTGLVCLGDVAEIYATSDAEAKQLSAVDLMPAPAAGEKRVLRVRDLQDILALRGINPAAHRISGASQVMVSSAVMETRKDTAKPQSLKPAISTARWVAAVRDAIEEYVGEIDPSAKGCQAKLSLDDTQAAIIAAARQGMTVEGGMAPWTRPQQFVLVCPTADGLQRVPVAATITMPPSVVVTTVALPRGAIIRPGDVKLQPGNPTEGALQVFTSIEDVIGKETTRILTIGQILDDSLVQRPLLVRRGEIVTVYARSAGIRVRTTARAREDGSQGDLITVESVQDRKSFFARVTGAQEVDVFGQAQQAPAEPQPARTAPRQATTSQGKQEGAVVRFTPIR
jgi:flagella basal body P-ring formation protein FlgA